MLSIEQRAERAVRRKNKLLAKEYPLFADQFETTFDDQVKRIEKQDADNVLYFERLRQGELDAWQRSLELKEQARQIMPIEVFLDYEKRYERIYGSRPGKYHEPEYVGRFAADWWHCAVRNYCEKEMP